MFASFTSKVKDTGEGVETTSEEEAKKLNIYDESRRYGPRLVAVGEGWLISGLDEEVGKMDVGEKKVIEILPEKAYGKRDPTQTRMVPLRKFGEREHEVEVGDAVEVENRMGIVRFIGSGRAQVDFNHRLAGKTIVYDFEVLSKVDTDEEKVRALIDRRLAADGAKAEFQLSGGELKIMIPEGLFLVEGLQIIKRGIATDVFKFVPTVADLTFEEKFHNEKATAKEEAKPKDAATAKATRPRKKKTAAAVPTPATS